MPARKRAASPAVTRRRSSRGATRAAVSPSPSPDATARKSSRSKSRSSGRSSRKASKQLRVLLLHGMEGGPKSTKSVRLDGREDIDLYTPQLPSKGLAKPWPVGNNVQLTAAWFILLCCFAVVGRAVWCASSGECGARAGPVLATIAATIAGGAAITALLPSTARVFTGLFVILLAGGVVLARAAYCATQGGCGASAGPLLASIAAITASFTAAQFLRTQAARELRDSCADAAAAAVKKHQPDVVIASSLGCAAACELAKRGEWNGATVLLAGAQAAMDRRCGGRKPFVLPRRAEFASTLLVHAKSDSTVPFDDSLSFVEEHGLRWPCELVEVEDDHRLSRTATGEALEGWVRQAYDMAQ